MILIIMNHLNFIDNLQSIVTEYMKLQAYSVGISDLIADEKQIKNYQIINEKKKEVNDLINQLHLGVFENKQVNQIRLNLKQE